MSLNQTNAGQNEAMQIWAALKPMIDAEIDARTRSAVESRKMKVTTAPDSTTNVIGVTEAFGTTMSIPAAPAVMDAVVGDYVWVYKMYGSANNMVAMHMGDVVSDKSGGGTPITYPITVPNGGTNATSFTSGNYLVGNGMDTIQSKTPAQVLADIGAQPAFSLLWSGSAATGNAITVPGIANYSIFMVEFTFSDAWAGIGFGKALSTTILEASVVLPASTQSGAVSTYNLYGTMSGNTLTITFVNGLVHHPSGTHSAALASTITKIWGVL